MNDISRREFVNTVAKSCLGVSAILSAQDLAGIELATNKQIATAKSVIFLYMSGGMTHVDTLDPKPENSSIMGETTAINTSADGIQLGSWLPKTAQQMHNATLIRSLTTTQGDHAAANYLLHTSYQRRGTIIHPTLGAWISKKRYKLNSTLPMNVRINGGSGILGAGYLEKKHGPLPLGNPQSGILNAKKAGYVSDTEYDKRLSIASKFNSKFGDKFNQKQVRAYTDLYDDAIKLMRSSDLQAFDLTQEPEALRQMYGQNNFGQGCLLARRLVESGVRYIEVNLGGWDMHNDVFGAMETRGATLDDGLSTLLHDLERRGMLHDTLVVLATEFGRTPVIRSGRVGRDHHPTAFSALLAGGGVKEGFVYGKSDKGAHYVEENGVGMDDLNATIARTMGLDTRETIYSPEGRPFKIANSGKIIRDILA
jgi:hypothetical protein